MDEKDIERIMRVELPVPSSCNKAANDAFSQIKTSENKASATSSKSKHERARKLPIASAAAIVAIAVVCAGGILAQQHDKEIATSSETVQEAIDYRNLCQNELEKLTSIAGRQDANGAQTNASSSAAQSSATADGIDAKGQQLSELITDYENQLNALTDDNDLQNLYKQICASVEEYE